MFNLFRKSQLRRPTVGLAKALLSNGLPPDMDPSTLAFVQRRGSYAGRRVNYFRVYDPTRVAERNLRIKHFADLDASPELVIGSGHVEVDGVVVLSRRDRMCYTCATGLPRRQRAHRPGRITRCRGQRRGISNRKTASRMPRHYVDEESDRDALFARRNLVSVEFAAEQLKVTPHAVEKVAGRAQGPLLMWIFGGRGQVMRKYREAYVDMGPSPGPDLSDAWRGHSPANLLGEARQRQAAPNAHDGLNSRQRRAIRRRPTGDVA